MLSRIGRAAIWLGLTVAISGASAQDAIKPALEGKPIPDSRKQEATQGGQPEARQKETEPDRLVPALNSIESAIRDLISEENTTERNRQEQREVADLQAQQDMVHWAKLMFIATAFTVGLTFVGLVLIWRTLIYTRHAAEAAAAGNKAAMLAAKEAQKTSDAAIAANTLNREAFIAEYRPWLKVDVAIGGPLKWDVNGDFFEFGIVVENIGRAPALHVMARINIILAFAPFQLDEAQASFANKVRESSIRMGGGSTVFLGQKMVFPHAGTVSWIDINEHIATNKQKGFNDDCIFPHLIGCVDYRSPSRTEHQTGFIYSIHRRKGAGYINAFIPSEGEIQADAIRLIYCLSPGRIC